jgi:hypothetical protein
LQNNLDSAAANRALHKARFPWLTARATTREKLVDQSFRLWRREGRAFEDHFCA